MSVRLDQIVPWGRSLSEYELMFQLKPDDLAGGVLDCGAGPASFNAELTATGVRVISVDPLYTHPGPEIRARFEATEENMLAQIRAAPDDWTWGFHKSPEDLCASRRATLFRFLEDYDAGVKAGRYVVGELPLLPFDGRSFGLAVCSHLLFLYSRLLSEGFHVRAALELCRVAREVRFFPLLTLAKEPSPHVPAVRDALAAAGWSTEVVTVSYELQRGGNQMLRAFRG